MANIRPMATQTTTTSRLMRPTPATQTRPVQPVRTLASADKAMASIRPMAVAHAPTATVLPTTQVTSGEGGMKL